MIIFTINKVGIAAPEPHATGAKGAAAAEAMPATMPYQFIAKMMSDTATRLYILISPSMYQRMVQIICVERHQESSG